MLKWLPFELQQLLPDLHNHEDFFNTKHSPKHNATSPHCMQKYLCFFWHISHLHLNQSGSFDERWIWRGLGKWVPSTIVPSETNKWFSKSFSDIQFLKKIDFWFLTMCKHVTMIQDVRIHQGCLCYPGKHPVPPLVSGLLGTIVTLKLIRHIHLPHELLVLFEDG